MATLRACVDVRCNTALQFGRMAELCIPAGFRILIWEEMSARMEERSLCRREVLGLMSWYVENNSFKMYITYRVRLGNGEIDDAYDTYFINCP